MNTIGFFYPGTICNREPVIFKVIFIFIFFLCLPKNNVSAQTKNLHSINVQSYHVHIEPDIPQHYISGNVIIKFSVDSPEAEIVLDCGDLIVDNIEGPSVKSFRQKDHKLFITLTDSIGSDVEIQIFYHGNPSGGVIFLPDTNEMYTAFSTDEWMVSNMDPDDRATINIELTVPDSLTSVANGILVSQKEMGNNKLLYSWHQSAAVPAYTYGFAIGPFNKATDNYGDVPLIYYSGSYDTAELLSIFTNTPDMVRFFEEKSGILYSQASYNQILIGRHYQEMSGFSVLRQSYGDLVLQDSTEQNLISHELAHQWWGNMITCKNWSHFWLNEAFATYMSAAYNEDRFGKYVYMNNIDAYYDVYKNIEKKGNDRPLVYEDWSNPSSDDRNLVYFKGAYVLHLLRMKLGDPAFWSGIKYYSRKYYGASVTSKDFQNAMEKSTGVNLDEFFNKWVY